MRLKAKLEKLYKSRYFVAAAVMALSVIAPISSVLSSPDPVSAQAASLSGKKIKEVSTGYDAACATADGWAYCWGANDLGQLGNGKTSTGATSTPVAVSSAAAVPGDPVCKTYVLLIFCSEYVPGPPKTPASAMAGKYVEKVSVGFTHACAIADASVYCWGDNSHGQLGNRTTKNSSLPVKVDTQSQDESGKPKSALAQKEIVDVATGEFFSCALASDGTVACWGEGDQGRLGTGNESDVNYPKAVDTAPGSSLAGKKGVKLARASIATMCVLAVSDAAFTSGSKKGNPHCWGVGIGNDEIPGPGRVTVPCNKNSPATKPTGQGVSYTFFTSDTPIEISSTQQFSQVDGVDYLTGLADNGRAYYWGMHGYRENNTYVSTTTCSVNPCTSSANSTIKLAASANDQRKKAQNNAKNNNKPGGDKKKNLNSNNTAAQSAQNAARGGVSSSVSASGGNVRTAGSLSSTNSYSTVTSGRVAQNDAGLSYNTVSYRGVARPGGSTGGGANVGNNNNNNNGSSCAKVTRYGYTADRTVDEVGKMTPTVPHASALNQSNLNVLAGNVEAGLFCATNSANVAYCDANGTAIESGQTGSNYTKQCTTNTNYFLGIPLSTTTTCAPAPTGPQQVVNNGWLAGKTISQLSIGLSGYVCALASDQVGCWGVNSAGQLGTGDTAIKKVPTALKLQ